MLGFLLTLKRLAHEDDTYRFCLPAAFAGARALDIVRERAPYVAAARRVVVDFTALTDLDASAVAALVRLLSWAGVHGRRIESVGAAGAVADRLAAIGLDARLPPAAEPVAARTVPTAAPALAGARIGR